ncbi:uncharacterized protein LOC116207011 [Punica granatum]|uniref:Uncharacterized protein n=2 Tax=Punica granatum TaxID=22663 RepID=A0A218XBN9_PUNGR|nr:uncharacterized protein LOC116207011 [Punica granatum]OWM81772.1 hypothetical protein CDL15_Pgr007810 [Punica granatum]PKI43421.1 hypothetical protein CRG98_036178 [Punica granatum]
MADESIDDGEFWLPPQFLEDDLAGDESDLSDLSSPVESVAGSAEDWSDEEDHLAGLRKKMACSTLQGDFNKLDQEKCKGWFRSGSPKSTLHGFGGGCGPMQRLLTPATVHVLCGATSKVPPMKMSEQAQPCGSNRRMVQKSDAGFIPHQLLSQRQLQATHLQRLRQQQMIQSRILGQHQVVHDGPLGQEWPPLQQAHQKNHHVTYQLGRPGAGAMRAAVFLGAPGTRPCTGTGVFLPRQVGARPEPRKRQARSPVLIPAKVVQALNLRFESRGPQTQQQPQSRSNGCFTFGSDGTCRFTSEGFAEPRTIVNHETIQLPPEWTY